MTHTDTKPVPDDRPGTERSMKMDSMTIRERPPESEPYPSGTEPVETPVGYTDAQESNLRIVTNSLHRLNEAITEAVLGSDKKAVLGENTEPAV